MSRALSVWADRAIAGHVAAAAHEMGLEDDDTEGRREIVQEVRDEVNGLNDWSGRSGGNLSSAEREAVVAAARRWLEAH